MTAIPMESIRVPFDIFHYGPDDEPGIEPGYYFTIIDEDEPPEEGDSIAIAGPYTTREVAERAAISFIEDALTDFQPKEGEVEVH